MTKELEEVLANCPDEAISGAIDRMRYFGFSEPTDEQIMHMITCARSFRSYIDECRKGSEIFTPKDLKAIWFPFLKYQHGYIADLPREKGLIQTLCDCFQEKEGHSALEPDDNVGVIAFINRNRLIPGLRYFTDPNSQEHQLCQGTALLNILIWGMERCSFNSNLVPFYVSYPLENYIDQPEYALYIPNVPLVEYPPIKLEPLRLGEEPRYGIVGGVDVIATSLLPGSDRYWEGMRNFGAEKSTILNQEDKEVLDKLEERLDHIFRLAAKKKITHLVLSDVHGEVPVWCEDYVREVFNHVCENHSYIFKYIIRVGTPVTKPILRNYNHW